MADLSGALIVPGQESLPEAGFQKARDQVLELESNSQVSF